MNKAHNHAEKTICWNPGLLLLLEKTCQTVLEVTISKLPERGAETYD